MGDVQRQTVTEQQNQHHRQYDADGDAARVAHDLPGFFTDQANRPVEFGAQRTVPCYSCRHHAAPRAAPPCAASSARDASTIAMNASSMVGPRFASDRALSPISAGV